MKQTLSLFIIGSLFMSISAKSATLSTDTINDAVYFEIGDSTDWKEFAIMVNDGCTTINGILTQDVDLGNNQSKVGTDKQSFSGTFDGNGHTLTIAYVSDSTDKYCGPFQFVGKATIKNLHATGSIFLRNHRRQYLGGIIGCAQAGTALLGCWSSVSFTLENNSSAFVGGLVGYSYNITLTDCLFTGSIKKGKNTSNGYAAGLVGEINKNNFTISNSLVAATMALDTNNPFHRIGSYKNCVNCFYLNNCNYKIIIQGTETTEETLFSGTITYALQNGSRKWTDKPVWVQTLGRDSLPRLAIVADESAKQVRKVIFISGTDTCTTYANTDTVTQLNKLAGFNYNPLYSMNTKEDGTGDTITDTLTVSRDTTMYLTAKKEITAALTTETDATFGVIDAKGKKVSLGNGAHAVINKSADRITVPSTIIYKGDTLSVISIADSAFGGCDSLMWIDVTALGEVAYTGRDNGVFAGIKEHTLIYLGCDSPGTGENVIYRNITASDTTYACREFKIYEMNPFSNKYSFTADTASLSRKFIVGQKGTIILPFSLDSATATSCGSFYKLKSHDCPEDVLYFERVDVARQCSPYIFVPGVSTIGTVNVTVATVNYDTVAKKADNDLFIGSFTSKTFEEEEENCYGYASEENESIKAGSFVHITKGAFLPPYRCYIMRESGVQNSSKLKVMIEDAAADITAPRANYDRGGWYTPQGVSLSDRPTRHGVYIYKGKKIVL